MLAGDDGLSGDEEPELVWRTGTLADECIPVFVSLAKLGIAGLSARTMDLTHVALVLGHGMDPAAAERQELAELARRRRAGEDVTWGD